MDLNEVVNALPEDQRGVVLSAIEAEKQRGIEETRKKGSEAAKLRNELNKYRDSIKNTFEVDVSSVDELPEILGKFKTQTVDKSEYVPVKDFEMLKKQIAERDRQVEEANANLRNSKIAERLNKVLTDSFHAGDYLVKDLIAQNKVRLTSDNEVVFLDGDEELDITKGIEKLKKMRPDLVKNTTKPGSGSAGGDKNKKDSKISYAEFEKLNPVQQRDYMAVNKGFSE